MRRYRIVTLLVVMALLLLSWQLLHSVVRVPSYVLPPPTAVADELLRNSALFAQHLGVTAFEAGFGLLIGASTGVVIALMIDMFPFARLLLLPLVIALQTFPKETLGPLYSLVFGLGMMSKIIFAATLCFFPVCINLIRGLRRIEAPYIELFGIWGASSATVLFRCRINFALPFLFAGLRLAATLSVVGAVVGEFAGSNAGIGFLMRVSAALVNAPQLYAAIACLTVLGAAYYGLVVALDLTLAPFRRSLEA